jgi:hypothetical protein
VLNAIAPTDARKDGRLVVAKFLRYQYTAGLADYFRCRIPEDALGASIPARDRTVEIFADDGVFG